MRTLAAVLLLAGCASASTTPTTAAPTRVVPAASAFVITGDCDGPADELRTDNTAAGNRISDTTIEFGEPLVVELPDTPVWLLPYPNDEWYVTLENGTAVVVDQAGAVHPAISPSGEAPPNITFDDHGPVIGTAYDDHGLFEDPLPDTRSVRFGDFVAALAGPTDRYGHGVLGDAVEASRVEIRNVCTGNSSVIEVAPPSVIEGISPMFVDLDDDSTPEVLVTTSNNDRGAQLELYAVDGTLIAQSEPIGTGNRWRNQLGAAPFGPDGTVEIVDVRVPHIGGVVEFFRLVDDRLERVADTKGYTNHVIGSRNLDMGVLVDTTGDGQPEVVLPTQDRQAIAILQRTQDGVEEAHRIAMASRVTTNIAVAARRVAVGTTDGTLHIWAS